MTVSISFSFCCPTFLPPEYSVKQSTNHPDPDSAMVNLDALHTVLLSLHPKDCLGEYDLSDETREGLAELHHFNNLILLGPHTGHDGKGWRYCTLHTPNIPHSPLQGLWD